VSPDDVYAALLDEVSTGVPFVQAMISRSALLGEQVEHELAKSHVPKVAFPRVSAELATLLPVGMCERLLAVPLGLRASGEYDVACVNPMDPAVGAEFAYQLRGSVRLSRSGLAELLLAIERWLDERDASGALSSRTPAFGSVAARRPSSPGFRYAPREESVLHDSAPPDRGSAPPIPLVRRSMPPVRERVGTDPGVGHIPAVTLLEEEDEAGEPVIGLFRSKPPPRPETTQRVTILDGTRLPPPDPARLDAEDSADGVVQRLAELATLLAQHALVFVLRGKGWEARAASPGLGGSWRGIKLAAVPAAVIERAARDEHFLGRLPDDALHADLGALLGDAEVYVTTVRLKGRPAASLLIAGMAGTLDATRRADELAERASAVLERIVREKKRGG
jgi:MshEN domain